MKKIQLLIVALFWMVFANAQNITEIEYWVDSDPGFGFGLPLTGFSQQPLVSNFAIVIAGMDEGAHTIGFRTKDSNGKWSHTNFI